MYIYYSNKSGRIEEGTQEGQCPFPPLNKTLLTNLLGLPTDIKTSHITLSRWHFTASKHTFSNTNLL